MVEEEYTTQAVHQGYIEPHAATAHYGSDGYVTVWCSSQGHFAVRDHTSKILDLPVSRVKVVPMEIGGGFGGKGQGGVYLGAAGGQALREDRSAGKDSHDP